MKRNWVLLLTIWVLAMTVIPGVVAAKPLLTDRLVLMWQVQKDITDEELQFLKAKGVNLVQSYPLAGWTDREIKDYLDRMNRYNIGIIMPMGHMLKRGEKGRLPELDEKRAERFILKWKNHPAVFAWHVIDEPSMRLKRFSSRSQEAIYTFVKRIDPEGFVFMSWNGVSERDYKKSFSEHSFDILDVHAFPHTSIGARQRNQVKNFKKYYSGKYPVIFSLRVFNNPKRRGDLRPDGLQEQYDLYFKDNSITENIGFYGWKLSINRGITSDSDMMNQFKKLEFGVK